MIPLFIRSYGRRKARKLRSQSQSAYDEILPLVRLKPEDFKEAHQKDVWLEIGFGGGEHMLGQLTQNPNIQMIGCEPFMNGIAKLLARLSQEDYGRVKIWPEDVRHLLEQIAPSYFSRVFILFPDPWPKKRHQIRRLISREFMEKLFPTLKKGALLYIASDDPSYVEQIQEILYSHPAFSLKEGPPSADPSTWGSHPDGWPYTSYEQKALRKGHLCAYMVFEKNG